MRRLALRVCTVSIVLLLAQAGATERVVKIQTPTRSCGPVGMCKSVEHSVIYEGGNYDQWFNSVTFEIYTKKEIDDNFLTKTDLDGMNKRMTELTPTIVGNLNKAVISKWMTSEQAAEARKEIESNLRTEYQKKIDSLQRQIDELNVKLGKVEPH
jgi:hypothetical protein